MEQKKSAEKIHEIPVASLRELDEAIASLEEERKGFRDETEGGYVSPFLFRGQADSSWDLETTLERRGGSSWSFSRYLESVEQIKPKVQKKFSRSWDFPSLEKLSDWTRNYSSVASEPVPGLEFLVYLRHYGFPAPLLDWSRSLDIAVFFAFQRQAQPPDSGRVAVFSFLEYAGNGKEGNSKIPRIESNAGSDDNGINLRHTAQKGAYTFSAKFHADDKEWRFCPHEVAISSQSDTQDHLRKIILPYSLRGEVLDRLKVSGVTEQSLLNPEEAFLEDIAGDLGFSKKAWPTPRCRAMGTSKLVIDGDGQLALLPKAFHFNDSEVAICKVGDAVVLLPRQYSGDALAALLRDIGPLDIERHSPEADQKGNVG